MKFDVLIIGAGPAGISAGLYATKKNLKVGLVDYKYPGGTCLHYGCIPSKYFLKFSSLSDNLKSLKNFFDINFSGFNWQKISEQKNRLVSAISSALLKKIFDSGITFFQGKASFVSQNLVNISGEKNFNLEFDSCIIATGSKPKMLSNIFPDGKLIFTIDEFFAIPYKPVNPVIIGAGVSAIEITWILTQMDSNVNLIEIENTILPGFDLDVSNILYKTLERKNVRFFLNSKILGTKYAGENKIQIVFEKDNNQVEILTDCIIIAAGRGANIENLNIEKINIETENGFIKVDDFLFTGVNKIYACGDVIGKNFLASVADAEGKNAVENIIGNKKILNYNNIPKCIFGKLEVVCCGESEINIRKKYKNIFVIREDVISNPRNQIENSREGFVKLIIIKKNNKKIIKSVSMVGKYFSELAPFVSLLIKNEIPINEIETQMFIHPTLSESLMYTIEKVKDEID